MTEKKNYYKYLPLDYGKFIHSDTDNSKEPYRQLKKLIQEQSYTNGNDYLLAHSLLVHAWNNCPSHIDSYMKLFSYEYEYKNKKDDIICKVPCFFWCSSRFIDTFINYHYKTYRSFYEVIDFDKPLRMYFDIDIKRDEYTPLLGLDDFKSFGNKLLERVMYLIEQIMINYLSLKDYSNDKHLLRFSSSNDEKFSFHLHIIYGFFKNMRECSNFYRIIIRCLHKYDIYQHMDFKLLKSYVDHNVYKHNQQFRYVNSTKLGVDRPKTLVNVELNPHSDAHLLMIQPPKIYIVNTNQKIDLSFSEEILDMFNLKFKSIVQLEQHSFEDFFFVNSISYEKHIMNYVHSLIPSAKFDRLCGDRIFFSHKGYSCPKCNKTHDKCAFVIKRFNNCFYVMCHHYWKQIPNNYNSIKNFNYNVPISPKEQLISYANQLASILNEHKKDLKVSFKSYQCNEDDNNVFGISSINKEEYEGINYITSQEGDIHFFLSSNPAFDHEDIDIYSFDPKDKFYKELIQFLDDNKDVFKNNLIDFTESNNNSSGRNVAPTSSLKIEYDIIKIGDLSLATYFFKHHPDNYIFYNKQWFFIDQYNVWKKINSKSNITSAIYDFLNNYYNTLNNAYINNSSDFSKDFDIHLRSLSKYIVSQHNLNNILTALEHGYTKYDLNNFDKNRNIIPFDDCCFDLHLLDFRPYTPKDYVSITTGYKLPKYNESYYNEASKILSTIFEDPVELFYVIVTFANCLFGRTQDLFLFLYGEMGRNGKTVCQAILRMILGKDLFMCPKHTFITSAKSDKNEFDDDIVKLNHARVCWIDEVKDSVTYQSEIINTISGGSKFSGRAIYGNKKEISPVCVLIISSNYLPTFYPKIPDATENRLKTILFKLRFLDDTCFNSNNPSHRHVDIKLRDRFNDSDPSLLSGFLYLFISTIRNRKVIKYDDVKIPQSFLDLKKEIIDFSSPLKSWFENTFVITGLQSDKVKIHDVHSAFRFSSLPQDLRNKYTDIKIFGKALKSCVPELPDSCNSHNIRYYKGVKSIINNDGLTV